MPFFTIEKGAVISALPMTHTRNNLRDIRVFEFTNVSLHIEHDQPIKI